jgi:hypothetical protein
VNELRQCRALFTIYHSQLSIHHCFDAQRPDNGGVSGAIYTIANGKSEIVNENENLAVINN